MKNREIKTIKPYHKNAKKHPAKQIEAVAKSIDRFGFNQPIVVDAQGVIIVGHARYEAAKLLGLKEVPVLELDLSEEEVKAYRLADNKLNESEWDMSLVIEELKGLSPDMLDLTGFSKDLILDDSDKDDLTPDLPEIPKSKEGDLYELGSHRIVCGDATKPEGYEKLMAGVKADMLFTDPPYNIDYKGSGKKTSTGILNDKMMAGAFVEFLTDALIQIKEVIKKDAGCYIFHSHKTAGEFQLAISQAGYKIDTQLIWNKPSAGLGMGDYRTKHEPFFYFGLTDRKTFYGDRTGTTVWRIPEDNAKALKWFRKMLEKQEKGETTVWTLRRDNVQEYMHPTQKPVELAMIAIIKSSKQEDIVLDPFIGSGTTLIASQKTNRICYGMDLDPKYVDVTVKRWLDYTGNEEVIKNGKKIKW